MNGWVMWFTPKTMKINIDWPKMRQAKHWKRQAIALYLHELTHLYDWIFTYKQDFEEWELNEKKQELRANKTQDITLTILGLKHLTLNIDS